MDSNQVTFWLSANADKFSPTDLPAIKAKLDEMDNNQMMFLQNVELKKPSTIFLIALLFGWERFFLGDISLGILKVVTGYGCGIWWLIDIFSAKKRAMTYNLKQFQKATSGTFGNGTPSNFASAPKVNTNNDNQPATYKTEYSNSEQVISPTQGFVNQPQGDGVMQKLFNRAKNLFLTPHTEYRAIEKENPPHTEVLTKYALLLAIIPFLFAFIGYGLIGYSVLGQHFNDVGVGFRWAFDQVFLLLGGVYITALIINLMADKFGGQKDFNRAFALVAYAYMPMFVAGVFHIYSGATWLVFAIGIYGLYLLVAGLHPMMKPAEDKAEAYSTISFIMALAVYVVLWKLLELIILPSTDALSSFSRHYSF
jgi:hypothetical protein